MSKDSQHMWRLAARYSSVGIEMCVGVALGTGAGAWLDKRFATSPWLLLVGFVVGVGAAIMSVYKTLRGR